MKRLLTPLFCILLCASLNSRADDDFQSWNMIAINGPVAEGSKWLAWFDGHARFRNDANNLGTSIIRPAFGYRVNDKLDVWFGWARVTGHRDGPDFKENRIWQQATYPIAEFWGGKFSGRTRLEQRKGLGFDDVGLRLRQFVRWARPIPDTDFSYVFMNELFVASNDTDWGQDSGYDQNRAFFGAAWQIKEKLRFEAGYMHNHLNRAENQTNHVLSLNLFVSL